MLGKLLSVVIKTVTLPVDATNAGMDILSGGDGTKDSRMNNDGSPFTMLENLRDRISDSAKDIDN